MMKKKTCCDSTRCGFRPYQAMPSFSHQSNMMYQTGSTGVISILPSFFLSSLVPVVLTVISILLLIIVVVPVIL